MKRDLRFLGKFYRKSDMMKNRQNLKKGKKAKMVKMAKYGKI